MRRPLGRRAARARCSLAGRGRRPLRETNAFADEKVFAVFVLAEVRVFQPAVLTAGYWLTRSSSRPIPRLLVCIHAKVNICFCNITDAKAVLLLRPEPHGPFG